MGNKPIGLILDASDVDYSSVNKLGKVTIEYNEASGQVEICVEGFGFDDPPSCRTCAARGMAWAADMLKAQLQVEVLAPGGMQVAVG